MYNTRNLGFGAPDHQLLIVNYAMCPFTRQPQLNAMVSLNSLSGTEMVPAKQAGQDVTALTAAQIFRSFLHCACFQDKMQIKEIVFYQHENVAISKYPERGFTFFPSIPHWFKTKLQATLSLIFNDISMLTAKRKQIQLIHKAFVFFSK